MKVVIRTENLTLEAYNFNVHDNVIILAGTINDDAPLTYWLKISNEHHYSINITSRDTIDMSIPINDITNIHYFD